MASRDDWPSDLKSTPEEYVARADSGATVNADRLYLANQILEAEREDFDVGEEDTPSYAENTPDYVPPSPEDYGEPEDYGDYANEGSVIPAPVFDDERLLQRSVQVDTATEEFRPTSTQGLGTLLRALQNEGRPYRIINRFTRKVYGEFGHFREDMG